MKNLVGSIYTSYPQVDIGFGIKRIVFGGGRAQKPSLMHSTIHRIAGSFSVSIPFKLESTISTIKYGETNDV